MKSWNEIRQAATAFSKRWKDAYDEKSQVQSFLKEFFGVFAVDAVTVATRPLVFYNSNASPQYYTDDGNKNVSDLTDSTQSLTAHCSYAPFGALLSSSGSSSPANPFRFSSEFADDALGLVYYNYRHYNPEIGRWMRRDVLIAVNGYLQVDNYMYNETDVLGLLFPGQGRVGPPILGENIPMINYDALPKEYSVCSFWGMVGGAVKKYDVLRLKPGGAVYEDAKRTIESELLSKVIENFVDFDSCSIKTDEPFSKRIPMRFGGRLFSNPLSSDWGPLTEGFWTLGNVMVDATIFNLQLKAELKSMHRWLLPGRCYCLITGTAQYSATLEDCFDFYPDRRWLGSPSEFAYNLSATPFSLGFNGLLEATRPKVVGEFSGTLMVSEARLR